MRNKIFAILFLLFLIALICIMFIYQKNPLTFLTLPNLFIALLLLLRNTLDTLKAITNIGDKSLSSKKVFFLLLPAAAKVLVKELPQARHLAPPVEIAGAG